MSARQGSLASPTALYDSAYGSSSSGESGITESSARRSRAHGITAWKKRSVGERKFAASLEQSLGERAILLNDRQVPKTKGDIDHLVVAGSGVWVVDAKNYAGLVQQRDVGGFFKVDKCLYVGGRDPPESAAFVSSDSRQLLDDGQDLIAKAIRFGWADAADT